MKIIIIAYMIFKQRNKNEVDGSCKRQDFCYICCLHHLCSACVGMSHRKRVQSFKKQLWGGCRLLPCKPRLYKFMDETVLLENYLESYSLQSCRLQSYSSKDSELQKIFGSHYS